MLSGKSRHTGEPLKEDLLKKNWTELLDAHYECDVPGPAVCLQDALHMITTGKVLITCPGAKKRKKDEQQDDDLPPTFIFFKITLLLICKHWRLAIAKP